MDIKPVDLTALVAVAMVCTSILVPVVGLTARFALKPLVEALARLQEARTGRVEVQMLEQRVALLERQLELERAQRAPLAAQGRRIEAAQ